jgi:hypothetical protein
MGFGPHQLRDKALLSLEESVQECRYRKSRRSLAIRFALAYLWSCQRGDRAPFDELWLALGQDSMWRFRSADHALLGIYRQLDLKRDEDASMRIWQRVKSEVEAEAG